MPSIYTAAILSHSPRKWQRVVCQGSGVFLSEHRPNNTNRRPKKTPDPLTTAAGPIQISQPTLFDKAVKRA